MDKVALVTGGSSGIGAACAAMLRDAGWCVFTISRHPFEAEGIRHVCSDVTDEGSVREEWLRELFPDDFSERVAVDWESAGKRAVARREIVFRDLALEAFEDGHPHVIYA